MPRAGFTTLSAGMAFLAGILASWLPLSEAGSDESVGQPATLSLDPITGSIVVSGGRLSPSSGSRSGMVVRIIEEPVVSQPPPFSSGRTVVVPRTRIEIGGRTEAGDPGRAIRIIEEPTVSHPPPFAKSGRSVIVSRSRIIVEDTQSGTWAPLRPDESAEILIEKLNQMNLQRDELVAVFESLKRKGIYRGDVIYKD
jgi:flagellar basal body P-ring protein FlgI